MIIPRESCPKW